MWSFFRRRKPAKASAVDRESLDRIAAKLDEIEGELKRIGFHPAAPDPLS